MSIPYIPLYVADYEADTAHLTLEEDGAYLRLLRLCWRTPGCSVPDDPKWIMRKMRVSADDYYRVVEPIIDEFFTRGLGRVFSARLQREKDRIEETSRKRSDAGRKGGRPAKALKTNDSGKSPAKAKQKQPEPEPEPDIRDTDVSLPPKRKTRISESAEVSESMVRSATKRGHSLQEAEAQFQKFKNDALAKGKMFVSWDRAFVTWLDSEYFRPITTGATNGRKDGSAAEMARRVAEQYTARTMGGRPGNDASQSLLSARQPRGGTGGGDW